MKKISFFTLLLLSSIVFIFSCRKDLSSYADMPISGISIDTTGQSALNIFQFDTLNLTPNLNLNGLHESDLTFEWKVNIDPGKLDYTTISTSRDLKYEVGLKPSSADRPYQILYTITDKNTDLQYIMAWPLAVRNSIGEGLVIAETKDDNTTDLSHIMSPIVTPDYDKTSIKHHVFSSINGNTIPGIFTQMRYTKLRGEGGIMMGLSSNFLATIKTDDYSLYGMNNDLFYADVPNRQHQMIGGIVQNDVYVGNGQLTAVWLEISAKFGIPFDSKFTVPGVVALNSNNDYPSTVVSFYDETKGRFVYQPSLASFGDRNMYEVATSPTAAFDPYNLPGKKNIAAAVNLAGDFLHILKDDNSNNIGLYILDGGGFEGSYIPPKAKAYYDLTAAPDIQNAQYFAFMDDQNILYYATKSKIYAVIYSTSTPTFAERYSVSGGEEITTFQVYRQADYPMRSSSGIPYMPTNNKQLVMSTYNGTEGKVHLLPVINFGVGNIDQANIQIYDGFDKITAIASQL